MSIIEELAKLGELHRTGALTDAEFTAAKAAVLAEGGNQGESAQNQSLQAEVDELKLQQEIVKLDRAWDMQRKSYVVRRSYMVGREYVPTATGSVIGGVFVVALGVIWTVTGFDCGVPFFGIVIALSGIALGACYYSNALRYEKALEDYQRRRAELVGRSHHPTA